MTSITDSHYRYTRLDDFPSSSAEFFADTLQKQQIILTEQDRDLEKVGDSVQLLKNMSGRIGTELEEQSIMLDDLTTDMERTGMKLDEMVKKIAKLTNMNDGRTITIVPSSSPQKSSSNILKLTYEERRVQSRIRKHCSILAA
ncbi:unnamed protein product [Cercopithifilaria johnstoni]|uniref:t-SNARE coiled-coil homology domain-containing protein n=1 Tax=Cercopithifilaria johnstoni TaxID=2874296 RepID=A0A8J2MRC2_9BILA|nr:unnamed protein product [Cercopithifilaria johnstoni]